MQDEGEQGTSGAEAHRPLSYVPYSRLIPQHVEADADTTTLRLLNLPFCCLSVVIKHENDSF